MAPSLLSYSESQLRVPSVFANFPREAHLGDAFLLVPAGPLNCRHTRY